MADQGAAAANHDPGESPLDPSGLPVAPGPDRDERLAGLLAMLSFWLCDLIGQMLVLWWARRHSSPYARRYAWASLVFDGLILVMMVPLVVFYFVVSPTLYLLTFVTFWLFEVGLVVLAVVMAVRAWRGHDVADGPLPRWLTDRMPPL